MEREKAKSKNKKKKVEEKQKSGGITSAVWRVKAREKGKEEQNVACGKAATNRQGNNNPIKRCTSLSRVAYLTRAEGMCFTGKFDCKTVLLTIGYNLVFPTL